MLNELWSDLHYRARALFRRGEVERELAEELEFHLQREAEELERLGMAPAEARRRARVAFGGAERIKEETRGARGTLLLETMLQDLRHAWRGLRTKPGFTAGVVLTLAFGIGANTAMFGILDRLFFRPPTYLRDAGRVQRVYIAAIEDGRAEIDEQTYFGRYLDVMRNAPGLPLIVGHSLWHMAVGEGDARRQYPVAGVSGDYWRLFDARPVIGRFFGEAEDRLPTGSAVVVLGHTFWQMAFGGRRDVIGRTMKVGRLQFTVIGVAPRDFVGLDDDEIPALYVPLAALAWDMRPEDHTRDYHWYMPEIAVKRPAGVTSVAAQAQLTRAVQLSRQGERPQDPAWSRTVAAEHPHVLLAPVQESRGPNAAAEARIVAWVSGVAVIVLLIACANVANLLLARSLARRRELALRRALGVSRARLAQQVLTESLLLCLLGAFAALAVVHWGGEVLRALFLPDGQAAGALADRRTLALMLATTLAAAVATALAPAAHALGRDPQRALADGGRAVGPRSSNLRSGLLLVQATLCVVLLVGAGLFVRSLINVQHLHLGYDVDPVVVATENMRGARLSAVQRSLLERHLADEARHVPGVVAATPAPSVPFWGMEGRYLFVSGIDSVLALGDFIMQAGNPDYFRVMGTRILRGRPMDAGDRAGGARVTVVSQGMARALWPGRDPIGQCLRIDKPDAPCTTIVGVAEDLHIHDLKQAHEYTYYVPLTQYDDTVAGMLLVRVRGDAAAFAEPVRRRLQRLMPGDAYLTTSPLQMMVDRKMRSWRLGRTMFLGFGLLALVLAAIGLYSVIAYGVAERRREIGVRIALGAPRATVLALVVRGGVRLVLAGIVLGSLIAAGAGRWLQPLLFHESSGDPVVYGIVAVVLLGVAWMATALPALAAARLDPSMVLREQ